MNVKQRRALRDTMDELLSLSPTDQQDIERLSELGLHPQTCDNSQLIALALFEKAKKGDMPAIKELRELIGEKNPERIEHAIKIDLEGVKNYAN